MYLIEFLPQVFDTRKELSSDHNIQTLERLTIHHSHRITQGKVGAKLLQFLEKTTINVAPRLPRGIV